MLFGLEHPGDRWPFVRARAAALAFAILSFTIGCMGPSKPSDRGADEPSEETPPDPPVLDLTDPVPAELREKPQTGPYRWQNVVIKGGGFVTGIVISRAAPNLIYARTDVGGAYRFNVSDGRWVPITDWMGQAEGNWMGIESIATDPVDPSQVYLAAGTYLTGGNGVVLHSRDFGNSWDRNPIPTPMGGNHDGRSMGERLAVDPNLTSKLYFASRNDGLWVSEDSSATWQRVASFPVVGDPGLGLSFVFFDGRAGAAGEATRTIYVGVATLSGPSLFRSTDAGATFEPVPGQPAALMPHHAVLSASGVMYLAYNNGPGPNDITAGGIYRFDPERGEFSDVSPPVTGNCGFGGIAVDPTEPDTWMASTIDLWAPDEIFRTIDGGETWTKVGTQARRDIAGADWLYFRGTGLSATGWAGDLEIDPWNPSRALYITGQGVWWSDDITHADQEALPTWTFENDGLEETVALDLVSPPDGAPLLTAIGDVAGFRHENFEVSPQRGMYSAPLFGNTNSIDFAELDPSFVVRVGTSSTALRGAYSTDGGTSWTAFRSEPPNSQGQGSVAVSADGSTLLWSPTRLAPALSRDRGATWQAITITNSDETPGGARVAADRVNPDKFYAVMRGSVYVSTDGGASFSPTMTDLGNGARLRPVFGVEGDVWLVNRDEGLWHSTDSAASFERVPAVEQAVALGFGQAAPGESYPALYLSGRIDGVAGIHRSIDAGQTWERIDDPERQFGFIGHITGDPRRFGRVYLGTGGRGIIYGDPAPVGASE